MTASRGIAAAASTATLTAHTTDRFPFCGDFCGLEAANESFNWWTGITGRISRPRPEALSPKSGVAEAEQQPAQEQRARGPGDEHAEALQGGERQAARPHGVLDVQPGGH